jgi:hypothetical protein
VDKKSGIYPCTGKKGRIYRNGRKFSALWTDYFPHNGPTRPHDRKKPGDSILTLQAYFLQIQSVILTRTAGNPCGGNRNTDLRMHTISKRELLPILREGGDKGVASFHTDMNPNYIKCLTVVLNTTGLHGSVYD